MKTEMEEEEIPGSGVDEDDCAKVPQSLKYWLLSAGEKLVLAPFEHTPSHTSASVPT